MYSSPLLHFSHAMHSKDCFQKCCRKFIACIYDMEIRIRLRIINIQINYSYADNLLAIVVLAERVNPVNG